LLVIYAQHCAAGGEKNKEYSELVSVAVAVISSGHKEPAGKAGGLINTYIWGTTIEIRKQIKVHKSMRVKMPHDKELFFSSSLLVTSFIYIIHSFSLAFICTNENWLDFHSVESKEWNGKILAISF